MEGVVLRRCDFLARFSADARGLGKEYEVSVDGKLAVELIFIYSEKKIIIMKMKFCRKVLE